MSILASLRSLLGRNTTELPLSQYTSQIMSGSDVDAHPITTKREAAEAYTGWIYAASSFIAEEVRALEWTLWRKTSDRKDEWEKDSRHAVNRVLERPNATESWGDLIERSTVSFNVAGEFYWRIIRDRTRAVGFDLILPHWVNEPTFADGRHTGWRITIPGRAPTTLPTEDVIRVYRPHPLSPWFAASAVEAAAVSHNFDQYVRAYGMTLFRNDGGVPAGLLSVEQDITSDQADDLRERWRQRYSRKRGEVSVLGKGARYEPITVSMGDLKFLELGQFTQRQVLAMYRVPASLLGEDSAGVNRATIDGHLYSFQRHALRPFARRIEPVMRDRVLPALMTPRDAERYWWEFESIVVKDRASTREEAKELLLSGASTVNEYRQKLDLDPTPDGDVYLVPNTHKVTSTLEPAPATEGERAPAEPSIESRMLLAIAERRARASEQTAAAAEARARALERENAERRAYTALRGLFASWWRDRDGDTISMRGLDEHNLTIHDLPDVLDGEDLRDWIERLKGPEGKRLARVSVERGDT